MSEPPTAFVFPTDDDSQTNYMRLMDGITTLERAGVYPIMPRRLTHATDIQPKLIDVMQQTDKIVDRLLYVYRDCTIASLRGLMGHNGWVSHGAKASAQYRQAIATGSTEPIDAMSEAEKYALIAAYRLLLYTDNRASGRVALYRGIGHTNANTYTHDDSPISASVSLEIAAAYSKYPGGLEPTNMFVNKLPHARIMCIIVDLEETHNLVYIGGMQQEVMLPPGEYTKLGKIADMRLQSTHDAGIPWNSDNWPFKVSAPPDAASFEFVKFTPRKIETLTVLERFAARNQFLYWKRLMIESSLPLIGWGFLILQAYLIVRGIVKSMHPVPPVHPVHPVPPMQPMYPVPPVQPMYPMPPMHPMYPVQPMYPQRNKRPR